MFDIIREAAYGLKLGLNYTVMNRHNLTERAFNPSAIQLGKAEGNIATTTTKSR